MGELLTWAAGVVSTGGGVTRTAGLSRAQRKIFLGVFSGSNYFSGSNFYQICFLYCEICLRQSYQEVKAPLARHHLQGIYFLDMKKFEYFDVPYLLSVRGNSLYVTDVLLLLLDP